VVDFLKRAGAILGLALALAACGHGDGQGPRSEAPSREAPAASRPGVEDAIAPPPAPREISTDRALSSDPGAGTPARESSLRVVEEGKGYLIAGQAAAAERRFATATRIDPTNGFAYYWLGRARAAEGDRSGAVGVLEKAESLLGPYPEWRDRAGVLLNQLR
jgi:Flp pilus assembly protein TadD